MKAQDVIQAYLQAEKDKQENDLREQEKIVREAKAILVESSYIWLNGLMDEFDLAEPPKTSAYLNYWPNSFHVSLHFTWQGVKGSITMYWRSDNQYGLNSPVLTFEFGTVVRQFEENSYEHALTFQLPTVSRHTFGRFFCASPSGPVDAIELGKFLAKVQYEINRRVELDRLDQIESRKRRIEERKGGFNYEDDLEQHFKTCMSEFPELADDWKQLLEKRLAEIAQIEKQLAERQAEEEELNAAWNAERERLKQEAETKFEPCVIYRVEYGARSEYDEELGDTFYTNTAYILDHQPDSEGWYQVVRHSQVSRAKLPNVIRIDEIICRTADDVPGVYEGPFTKIALHSEEFDQLTIGYWNIPPEVKRLPKPEEDITPTERRLKAVTGC